MRLTLKSLKDYFKEQFEWDKPIYIGKIDNNQEIAICFYNSNRSNYSPVIGGKTCKSTYIKPLSVLLKYTKNKNDAEIKAQEIYDFFEERNFYINNKRIFTTMYNGEPNDLGTDSNGVYEYSIELDLYVER